MDQIHPDYYQQNCQNQNQYSSHDKFLPPPSPPTEMDFLDDNQILSSDEFNSIFESFNNVVEGHSSNNNFIDDGCLRGVNYSNGFLDDEQLSKALDAIAMI
ncbi:13709_t:CDS:2 [Rhizophagus irregularis]|nr:13709_t:CDS:2 [Rhizophagus irregularis]